MGAIKSLKGRDAGLRAAMALASEADAGGRAMRRLDGPAACRTAAGKPALERARRDERMVACRMKHLASAIDTCMRPLRVSVDSTRNAHCDGRYLCGNATPKDVFHRCGDLAVASEIRTTLAPFNQSTIAQFNAGGFARVQVGASCSYV